MMFNSNTSVGSNQIQEKFEIDKLNLEHTRSQSHPPKSNFELSNPFKIPNFESAQLEMGQT